MSFKHRSGWNIRRVCLAGMCLVVALAGCCAAIAASKDSHTVLIDVIEVPLTQVVLSLTTQTGTNIVIKSGFGDRKVTARAENLTIDEALDLVVKHAAGVDYWKDDRGNYIIGESGPVEKAQPIVAEPPVFVANPEPLLERPVLKTETVKLQNVSTTDIMVALNLMGPADFFERRAAPVVAVIDEDRFTVEPLDQSSRGNGAVRLRDRVAPTVDPGSAFLDHSAGRSADTETGAGQATYPSYRTPPGTRGAAGTRAGATPAPAPTTGGGTTAGDNSLLPEGVTMVMPFSLDNSLIVRGTEEGIAEFKDVVHLLDIAPKQVMIKAEFIEVSTNDVKRFGIDWSINRINQSFSTGFNPPGNVLYNLTSGNLTASLRTELTRGSGKTINSPIITTLNNEVGTIQIQRSIPYWTSTVVTPGTGAATTAYTVHDLQVATGLMVLPRVNGDNTITLTMAPQVQDTGRIYTGPDGTEIPETRSQSIAIRRRVMNGETIVCGGFIRKNDSFSESRIPILGDLPIIGPLFRSVQRSGDDTELLIFVTPTIIGDRSAGSAVGVSP